MISYIPRLILSDVDLAVTQGTRGDAEASEGDVVTLLHFAFCKLITAIVGTFPVDFCNPIVGSIYYAHFEGTLSARASFTAVAPFVLLLAFDLSPLGARGFVESII